MENSGKPSMARRAAGVSALMNSETSQYGQNVNSRVTINPQPTDVARAMRSVA